MRWGLLCKTLSLIFTSLSLFFSKEQYYYSLGIKHTLRRKLQGSFTSIWAVTDMPTGSPGSTKRGSCHCTILYLALTRNGVGDSINSKSTTGKWWKTKRNTKQNKTNPTISKFTWTVSSLATLSKEQTDRALECLKRWSGAAEPGSVQRWQCHPVHTTIHYHRPQSLDCVLCNQLACSIVISQLIMWAASGGQLCLKPPPRSPHQNHMALKISQQQLSGSHQYSNF